MSGYLLLALAFLANGVANILLKLGAVRGLRLSGDLGTLLASNWQALVGVAIFAINVFFYFLALRELPLSVAYPLMVTMSFLIVNGYAVLALHEPIALTQYLGYGFIVCGVILVVMRPA